MPTIAIAPCRQMADYVESIRRAGAEVVELAHDEAPEAVVGRVDGLLLTGGGDVDPALYGAHAAPELRRRRARARRLRDRAGAGGAGRRSAGAGDLPRDAGAERGLRRRPRPGHPHRGERRPVPRRQRAPLRAGPRGVGDADVALRRADEGRTRGRRELPGEQPPSPGGAARRRRPGSRRAPRPTASSRRWSGQPRASAWRCSGTPRTSGAPASSGRCSRGSSRPPAADAGAGRAASVRG